MSSDQWCTPLDVALPLRQFWRNKSNPKGYVALDPFSNDRSVILARRTFTAGALHLSWRMPNGKPTPTCYVNDPYSNLLRCAIKKYGELAARNILELVCLEPVATSTEWWGVSISADPLVVFTKRIEFLDETSKKINGARFDSVMFLSAADRNPRKAALSPREKLFLECMGPLVRSVVRGRNWTIRKAKAA